MEYKTGKTGFRLVDACEQDCDTILDLIKGIAKYEKMEDKVIATKDGLRKSLFIDKRAYVVLAYENNKAIGFMLYFYNYSTFTGCANLYLEDLFLYEEYRHKGYGSIMLKILAQIAIKNNAQRIDWVCLDWNEPSLVFYNKIGAKALNEWVLHRLELDEIKKLAGDDIKCVD